MSIELHSSIDKASVFLPRDYVKKIPYVYKMVELEKTNVILFDFPKDALIDMLMFVIHGTNPPNKRTDMFMNICNFSGVDVCTEIQYDLFDILSICSASYPPLSDTSRKNILNSYFGKYVANDSLNNESCSIDTSTQRTFVNSVAEIYRNRSQFPEQYLLIIEYYNNMKKRAKKNKQVRETKSSNIAEKM